MTKMHTAVIYDSLFGNTELVAQKIAKQLQCSIFTVSEFDTKNLQNYDVLIIGTPVHGGRPSEPTLELVERIPANALQSKKVATFDTRMDQNDQNVGLKTLMKVIGFAAEKLAKSLQNKGGVVVGKPAGFIVEGKEGPLRKGELERVVQWVETLRV